MKMALKIASNAITAVLGIVMLLTMYAALSSRLNHGTPNVFGRQVYEVLSGSMEPKIHTGSIIFDNPHVNVKQLQVGDVITFNVPHENIIVTHRIAQVLNVNGQPVFETKGDANPTKDTWKIPGNDVIGGYSNLTIPYIGYYLNFLKTRLGVSLLLIVPGALLIIFAMASMFREILKLQKGTKEDRSFSADSANQGSEAKL